MSLRWLPCALMGALLVAGCHAPVRENVDALLCQRANSVVDPMPPSLLGPAVSAAAAKGVGTTQGEAELRQVGAVEAAQQGQPPRPKKDLVSRLEIPSDVPGSGAPKIVLPPLKTTPPAEMEKAVEKYFPSQPAVGADTGPIQAGPDGQPLTLADLEKLARGNSPLLRQAAADIESAKGAAKQAGLYPNPTAGMAGQTTGPGGGPIYGGFVGQTIKTAGKLKLAQAAAWKDLDNAYLAYRRAETDLSAAVRTGYFQALVAQQSIRANRALVKLTDAVYGVMVRQLKGGGLAAYEPMQVGVYAAQARAALITARNAYTLAWKQLASTLGLPAMSPTELAGRVDMPIPVYRYEQVLARVLSNHTDVKAAINSIEKARFNLQTARVTPIPDVNVQAMIQEDASPPGPARPIVTMTATLTLPVWDLNQGNIRQTQGALLRAIEESHRVRNELTSRVAEAFRRYSENRDVLNLYVKDILPKQVQAFRAAVKRHYEAGAAEGVAYNDLVTAEQNLVTVVGTYLTILGGQWQAVVDTASLLQTDDLFQQCERMPVAELPDLEKLLDHLPCCHPCNPLPGPDLRGADLRWPSATIGPPQEQPYAPAPRAGPEKEMAPSPRLEPPPAADSGPQLRLPAPQSLAPLPTASASLLLPPTASPPPDGNAGAEAVGRP